MAEYEKEKIKEVKNVLLGKKVVEIRYMTEEECTYFCWDKAGIVIIFEDGSYILPQSDNEGNNGGALSLSTPARETIVPTIYRRGR